MNLGWLGVESEHLCLCRAPEDETWSERMPQGNSKIVHFQQQLDASGRRLNLFVIFISGHVSLLPRLKQRLDKSAAEFRSFRGAERTHRQLEHA